MKYPKQWTWFGMTNAIYKGQKRWRMRLRAMWLTEPF